VCVCVCVCVCLCAHGSAGRNKRLVLIVLSFLIDQSRGLCGRPIFTHTHVCTCVTCIRVYIDKYTVSHELNMEAYIYYVCACVCIARMFVWSV
jgi:hypothetical protein